MKTKNIATFYAILAAAFYAINVPLSKLLLKHAQPTIMASFLYLGAGLGLFIYSLIEKATGKQVKREPLTKKITIHYRNGGIGYCSADLFDVRHFDDELCECIVA